MGNIRPDVEKRMLRTLSQKVNPSHAALLVIDVQNDFCAKGGLLDRQGFDLTLIKEMVPRLKDFIAAARNHGTTVFFIKNVYNGPNDWYLSDVFLEQMTRRMGTAYTGYRVCEPNSWGGSFYGGVEPLEGEAVIVKHRFSAFQSTDLNLILRSRGIRTLIVTGVVTNVCVESTARDGFFNDYYIVLVGDCCASPAQEDHRQTLKNIDRFFGQVVSANEVMNCWGSDKI